MSDVLLIRIREIVADATLNHPAHVTADSAAGVLEGWDSLAQVSIVVAVESEFNVAFGADEVHSLNSVAKLVEAIQRACT